MCGQSVRTTGTVVACRSGRSAPCPRQQLPGVSTGSSSARRRVGRNGSAPARVRHHSGNDRRRAASSSIMRTNVVDNRCERIDPRGGSGRGSGCVQGASAGISPTSRASLRTSGRWSTSTRSGSTTPTPSAYTGSGSRISSNDALVRTAHLPVWRCEATAAARGTNPAALRSRWRRSRRRPPSIQVAGKSPRAARATSTRARCRRSCL